MERRESAFETYSVRSSGENAMPLGKPRSVFCDAIDAAVRQFLRRIGVESPQSERRVGEVQVPVRSVRDVVRTVQALAVEAIGECHLGEQRIIQAGDLAIAMISHDHGARRVERQPVAAEFTARRIGPGGPGRSQEHGESFALLPAEDRVARDVAEQQVTGSRAPHRTFGPRKSARQFFQPRITWNERFDRRVKSLDGPLLAERNRRREKPEHREVPVLCSLHPEP